MVKEECKINWKKKPIRGKKKKSMEGHEDKIRLVENSNGQEKDEWYVRSQ